MLRQAECRLSGIDRCLEHRPQQIPGLGVFELLHVEAAGAVAKSFAYACDAKM